MNTRYISALILMFAAIGVTRDASSQNAEALGSSQAARTEVAGTEHEAKSKSVSLTTLSKELSDAEVRTLMRGYTKAIGAPCGYCHEENAETKGMNFASDANPMKQTARLMVRMTNDINSKYLAQLGDRRYAEPLTCGNCHQGHTSPPSFEPKP